MILAGIDPTRLKPGENRMPCPTCDRGPKDTALSVRLELDGTVIWHCHRLCGTDGSSRARDSNAAATPRGPRCRPTAARAIRLCSRALGRYRAHFRPSRRLPAGAGLCAATRRQRPALHARVRHSSGYIGPALVALITDICTGAPLSLHRTWIKPDGNKADVSPPRLLLKDHPIAGGVIRLWPDEAVTAGLGIAEGIETALSLAHGFTPVWACIDAGHLAKFPILNGVQDLIIAADNDDAGRKAASDCAARWAGHAAVRIIQADGAGCDLNDMVQTWVK